MSSERNMKQIPCVIIGTDPSGGILLSTVSPPFLLRDRDTVVIKSWCGAKSKLTCSGKMIFVSNENQKEFPIEFDMLEDKLELRSICIANELNEQYVIKIIIFLNFKTSLLLLKGSEHRVSIENLWIEIFNTDVV